MENKGIDLKVKINGVTINYDDLGNSEFPLIFIHGFPFDKNSWKFQLDELQKYSRVIAYDCRGYGKSSSDRNPFSIRLFADDLISLLDELKIEKAIICGLSMGGYVALNAISRFPERFHKLILSD